jgi:FkbM family methyltransferase
VRNVPAENLTVVNCALGAESSWIDMIIEQDNSGHSHVNTQTMGQGQIQMMTLDEYMDTIERPKVDYIKIDCEGYEYQIIQGGKQTLTRDRPIMVVEDKKHKDVGHVFYDRAIATLISWGAKELGRVRADVILGWS